MYACIANVLKKTLYQKNNIYAKKVLKIKVFRIKKIKIMKYFNNKLPSYSGTNSYARPNVDCIIGALLNFQSKHLTDYSNI